MPLIYSFRCNWIFVTFDSLLGSFLVAVMMVFFNAHLSHIAAMNLLNSILDLLFFLVNKFSLQWRESFLGSQPPNYKHIFGLRILWATTKKTNFRYAVNFYLLNCRKYYGQGRKSYYEDFWQKKFLFFRSFQFWDANFLVGFKGYLLALYVIYFS